jgi:phosphoesterase RecJ-like protein
MSDFIKGTKRDWSALIDLINSNQHFIFSTHLEPDADGLGSELGLKRVLTALGKTVHILHPSSIRTNISFLPHPDEIEVFSPDIHANLIEKADIFIAFDIGHYNRLADLCPVLETSSITKVSIDHHPGDKSQFDVCFDDATASSTGVMIYDLISHLDPQAAKDLEIALPLYAAMMSDTGNFRFNNTDPETLHAAAELVQAGVKPYELYVELYENLNTRSRLFVLQRLLETIQFDCDGRLAWVALDVQELQSHGVKGDDLHSLSDFIRSIQGVEIGASITKMPGQPTDVSMRSKGQIPVNGVAKHFDGGGHAFAAGCRLNGHLEADAKLLIEKCRQTIAEWDQDHASA